MTVEQLIIFLETLPRDYVVCVDCGAISDARSVNRNDELMTVSISKDSPFDEVGS